MVLPPIETTPVLLMRFTSKAPPDLITFVKERLAQGGIIVATEESSVVVGDGGGPVVLGLTTTQEELEGEAELVKLAKPTAVALLGYSPDGDGSTRSRSSSIMEHFTVSTRENFLHYADAFPSDVDPLTEYDSLGLFTSSDRVMLMGSMLDAITVLEKGSSSSNLSRKFDDMKVPYRNTRNYTRPIFNAQISSSVNPFQRQPNPGQEEETSENLGHVLREHALVDVISPAHVPHICDKILRETLDVKSGAPTRAMRDYYGEEIAFYFAWMLHFTRWLVVPGVMGLFIFVLRIFRGDTVDNCDLTPFHGLGTFLWGVLFLKFWDREEARLSYEFGTFSTTGYERRFFGARPEFNGELRPSPVTGMMERYYSPTKRRFKYIFSALVTAVLLAGAFFVMILSLNLQGYVRPRDDRERWGHDYDHPFFYPMLATFAEEGNIFDAASQWKCFLPVFLHVLVVMTMNKCYRRIAEKLTDWENHETKVKHENSLILKRFLFEAFDAYVILFYLAFFEKDMNKLRGELVSVFNVDTFRRLLIECLLPMVLQRLGSQDKRKSEASKKKDDEEKEADYAPRLSETNRDEYEQFDDYLEMLIELGYVTLFASAYPLAAFIAIFANFIEYRADAWKLSNVCLRPRSTRTDSIGTWKLLMKVIIWGAALTNCLIFCFSSAQMLQWMPGSYTTDDYGRQRFVQGKGWYTVFIMFGIERVLLVCGLLIMIIVPSVPEDVNLKEERRQWVREQMSNRIRASQILKAKSSGAVGFGVPTNAERKVSVEG